MLPGVLGPWGDVVDSDDKECKENGLDGTFDDNFVVNESTKDKSLTTSDCQNEDKTESFEPLPDSKQYLGRLESKLRRLQKTSLQKALSERRTDEARRLLDARLQISEVSKLNTEDLSEFSSDNSVEDNPVIRRLCPDKQAVNISELQHLLDYDSLQKIVQQQEKDELTSDKAEQNINCTPPNAQSNITTPNDSNKQALVNKTLNSEESKEGEKPKETNNTDE